jgi:hypothetical protein
VAFLGGFSWRGEKTVLGFAYEQRFLGLLLLFCFSNTAGGGRETLHAVKAKFPKSRQLSSLAAFFILLAKLASTPGATRVTQY